MKNNVNVVTKIHTTRTSPTSNFNYAEHNKPHDNDNGQLKHRVLGIDSIRCSNKKHVAEEQFAYLSHVTAPLNPNSIRKVKAILEIKSFKELNYKSGFDRRKALDLNRQMMKAEHPHSMVFSVLQADGGGYKTNGHYLHVHNIISPINMKTGHSTTGNETSWYRAVHLSNKVMNRNGYAPEFNRKPTIAYTKNGHKYHKYYGQGTRKPLGAILSERRNHGYSRIEFAQGLLDEAFTESSTLSGAKDKLRKKGIYLSCMRHHTDKSTGKKVLTEYKTAGNDPSRAIKLKDGKYGRLRKTWLIMDGEGGKIRTSKLGNAFSAKGLTEQLSRSTPILQKHPYLSDVPSNPHIEYTSTRDYRGVAHSAKHGVVPMYKHTYNSKQSIKHIRKHYPHYPAFIPKKMPKPSRPHVNTAGAMKQLMNAMNRNISRSSRFARQQAIQDALENYSKAKQEKAEAYASYKLANAEVMQNNHDIDQEVKSNNFHENMARLRDEQKEEDLNRRLNRHRS